MKLFNVKKIAIASALVIGGLVSVNANATNLLDGLSYSTLVNGSINSTGTILPALHFQ